MLAGFVTATLSFSSCMKIGVPFFLLLGFVLSFLALAREDLVSIPSLRLRLVSFSVHCFSYVDLFDLKIKINKKK